LDHEEAVTVRESRRAPAERQIAYTTVLRRWTTAPENWLQRERSGKAYLYTAAMSREERSARLMRDAFESGGDTDMVLAFSVEKMNAEESAQFKAALRRADASGDHGSVAACLWRRA